MDWLKKFYEKILLAGALVLLIVVATVLAFMIKSIAIAPSLPQPGNKPIATDVNLSPYSNAVLTLKSPPRWINPNAALLFPPVPVKAAVIPKDVPDLVPPPSITLDSVVRRPFALKFKAYVWDAKVNNGRNFQVNFLTENRSFFIEEVGAEVADRHGRTGYVISKFHHKIDIVDVPGINKPVERDDSELTVKHEGEDPIVLVLGKTATYPKRYARIQCQDKIAPVKLSLGETFESGDKTYKVIDIDDREVIIQDTKSGRKQTLSPMPVVPR